MNQQCTVAMIMVQGSRVTRVTVKSRSLNLAYVLRIALCTFAGLAPFHAFAQPKAREVLALVDELKQGMETSKLRLSAYLESQAGKIVAEKLAVATGRKDLPDALRQNMPAMANFQQLFEKDFLARPSASDEISVAGKTFYGLRVSEFVRFLLWGGPLVQHSHSTVWTDESGVIVANDDIVQPLNTSRNVRAKMSLPKSVHGQDKTLFFDQWLEHFRNRYGSQGKNPPLELTVPGDHPTLWDHPALALGSKVWNSAESIELLIESRFRLSDLEGKDGTGVRRLWVAIDLAMRNPDVPTALREPILKLIGQLKIQTDFPPLSEPALKNIASCVALEASRFDQRPGSHSGALAQTAWMNIYRISPELAKAGLEKAILETGYGGSPSNTEFLERMRPRAGYLKTLYQNLGLNLETFLHSSLTAGDESARSAARWIGQGWDSKPDQILELPSLTQLELAKLVLKPSRSGTQREAALALDRRGMTNKAALQLLREGSIRDPAIQELILGTDHLKPLASAPSCPSILAGKIPLILRKSE